MANLLSKPYIKTANQSFSGAKAFEKHERIARKSLHDLIVFYQALEYEMKRMAAEQASGIPIDAGLHDKMTLVREKYHQVMNGFMELGDMQQRHALICFADSIQDLMAYIHRRREH